MAWRRVQTAPEKNPNAPSFPPPRCGRLVDCFGPNRPDGVRSPTDTPRDENQPLARPRGPSSTNAGMIPFGHTLVVFNSNDELSTILSGDSLANGMHWCKPGRPFGQRLVGPLSVKGFCLAKCPVAEE